MNQKILGLLLLSSLNTIHAQSYNYKVDLVNIKSDKISVELECPPIYEDSIRFKFPAVIPGHHFWVNYGRFIERFEAFDKLGNSLPVVKEGVNDYKIEEAQRLKTISYKVNDTADSREKTKVKGWAETNFIKKKLFVINAGGVFGVFENMESLSVQVDYNVPPGLYGSTSLKRINKNWEKLSYRADDYHQLVDCPILFAKPDTATFMVGDTKIEIACYNEAGVAVAEYVANQVEQELRAVYQFTNNMLPVDKYTYLFFFEDFTNAEEMIYEGKVTPFKLLTKIIIPHGRPLPGALEHNNSTYAHLLFLGRKSSIPPLIQSTAVHEFMHIYTPLNLHSELISDFNYSEPVMSKHLWLYEGVTEYLTKLIKLRGGQVDLEDFLIDEIRPKIVKSYSYPEGMKFTEMSENIFDDSYRQEFEQVYNRGAILAFLLDIEILNLTNGEKDLKTVLFTLSERYGKTRAFDENHFIEEFVSEVHPELQTFFDKHIIGSEALDLQKGFAKIGINYTQKLETQVPVTILSNGHGVLDVMEAFGFYTINKARDDSPFMSKDKIRSSDMSSSCLKPYLDENGEFISEDEVVQLPVYRNGVWIEVNLTPKFKEGAYYCKIKVMDKPDESQKFLLNKWLSK